MSLLTYNLKIDYTLKLENVYMTLNVGKFNELQRRKYLKLFHQNPHLGPCFQKGI
jgi:hypothetical protein